MYTPPDIESSYKENDLGRILYDQVIEYKPEKIIDFGVLNGYSTICLGQAVKDNNYGHIFVYDLFDKYPYKYSIRKILEKNIELHKMEDIVTIRQADYFDWIKTDEHFDLLHIDISNTGEILELLYNKFRGQNKIILFEGGTYERDNIDWMLKYNKKKITESMLKYRILDSRFPSISRMTTIDNQEEL